jgi:hypothetical protein
MSPTKRTHKPLPKPWHARIRRDYIEYSLGYFETKEEAAAIERAFAADWPSGRGTNGHGPPKERRT